MKITKKGEYALKALIALTGSYDQRSLTLREISNQEDIPLKFLEQIMISLKRSGFVESIQGKHGGYFLSRSPKKITLGEIIRSIDGPLAPLSSASEIERKLRQPGRNAGLYQTLLEVRNAVSEILDKKTLSDIHEKSVELATRKGAYQMYYI